MLAQLINTSRLSKLIEKSQANSTFLIKKINLYFQFFTSKLLNLIAHVFRLLVELRMLLFAMGEHVGLISAKNKSEKSSFACTFSKFR